MSLLPSMSGMASGTASGTAILSGEADDRLTLPASEGAEAELLEAEAPKLEKSRQNLGILLSRSLAEMHGGSIMVRGSLEEGYRYVIRLPQIKEREG